MNKRKYCKQLVDYNDLVKKDDCKSYDLLFLRQKEILNELYNKSLTRKEKLNDRTDRDNLIYIQKKV